MKISQKIGSMRKIKCNNYEMKMWSTIKYLRSTTVTNESVQKQTTRRTRNSRKF
jgi:hypothetical protein